MDGAIVMSKNEQFMVKILEDFRGGRISRKVAAQLLNKSEKFVQRKAKRIKEEGIAGIKHKNKGREPANRSSEEIKKSALNLASTHYFDFNIRHCYEILTQKHSFSVSYSTFHSWCRSAGIGKRKRRRPIKKRQYRDRLGNEGLLLQMDGSHHKWNGSDEWVLIAAIDDATSDIPFGAFYKSEDTLNCMDVLRKIIEIRGVPESLYVDHAGWYGGLKRQFFSQFTRACEELGIKVLYANSPEAKGRIERAWQTIQDRLIPELRINGITAMDASNQYLQNEFIPKYWQIRNTVEAKYLESRYQRLPTDVNLDNVFVMKYPRKVKRDHTVMFDNRLFRLKGKWVGSLANKEIMVIEPITGPLRASYGDLELTLEEIYLRPRSGSKLGIIRKAS